MNHEIVIDNVTKDYGSGRGIFDLSLTVEKGEVFGFLGPNGAGKTTTIRNLMGFIHPDKGSCTIGGLDCFKNAAKIQNNLGYLAGEISFIDDMTGKSLLNFIADMKGMKNRDRMYQLCDVFELNLSGKVKKMSKGMKQKIGLISAFMDSPEILILDEPTSGLDPLMQSRFVDLIMEEKSQGRTIFMSSHMFEEVERTCDRTAIIRNGKIVAIEEMAKLRSQKKKDYILSFADKETARQFKIEGFQVKEQSDTRVVISVKERLPEFLAQLSKWPITDMDIRTQSLEELFMQFYDEEGGKN